MRSKRPDGLFSVKVPIRNNALGLKEVEVPLVIARDDRQAEVFAHMSVRTVGLEPKKRGTKTTRHNPREKEHP